MPNSPRTILAFDFGTKKIGIAVGQEITHTASPLPAIPAKDGIPNWQQLESIINQWQPDLFVVGHPINMDTSDNDITVRARKFANRLHGRFHKPIQLIDERLSTFTAKEHIAKATGTKRAIDSNDAKIDSVAAALILETWFSVQ